MTDQTNNTALGSRRDFLGLAMGAVAAGTSSTVLGPTTAAAQAQPGGGSLPRKRSSRRPNIVFIFSDQERFASTWPKGLSLPAHERLMRTGTTFLNHYCPAVMCTSSRAVLLTGLQTADNRMFENCDVPWVGNLSTKIPTVGHMLRKAGYYTAYKGKWHLNRKFDTQETDRLFTKEMDDYGFSDYFSPGDIIGHTLGGYQFDPLIASSAITWLRRNGRPLTDDDKPWALFVSLVNPHDIMYFNTDRPGEKVQDTGTLIKHAARAPEHEMFKATWDVSVPKSYKEPFDAPGRPKAHGEFLQIWDYVLGHIPPEEERWRRFHDYYVNCTRSVDGQVDRILQELDALGLTDNTVICFTSDHGEAAGAHGLHGKGPFAYEETVHLPFFMVHPDVRGGQDCRALTGHIDVVPTLLSIAGVSPEKIAGIAGRQLPGKDFSSVLTNPSSADIHAVRDAILFTYSGLGANDATLWKTVAEARAAGKNSAMAILKQGFKPDMQKRGSLRSTYDGRYKFTRYFAPAERNRPTNLTDLYKHNDVELFDLQNDPEEMNNLAIDKDANASLISTMNDKLERVIKAEIGVDDGREMPNIPLIEWNIDRPDL
ncbi:sulfatase [Rhodopseudomonas palustris TIE-1]|uniref:sulfatase-like hydrolase/transferase n=1 Tax=Rhodopseudomonas palustris TaxID=1076 RepID=UPI000164A924|nr:sulfatase-like hydrolase/transferase [Rhodopseudomonas palustris]ACF00723.1 sulfatase [Rhodopseudomonas palustris TIE-1]